MLKKLFGALFGHGKAEKAEAQIPNTDSGLPDDFEDAWEVLDFSGNTLKNCFDPELPQFLPFKLPAHIEYTDSNGNHSSRDIVINRFAQDTKNGWVDAFCEWRKQMRSFRYSRLQQFTDRCTGEIIEPPQVAAYLFEQYRQSPAGQVIKNIAKNEDILSVLVTVARADRRMAASERIEITRFFLKLCGLPDELADTAGKEIKTYISEQASIRSFNSLLRKIAAEQPEIREPLYTVIEKVVSADKKTTTEEQKMLNWAKKILITGE